MEEQKQLGAIFKARDMNLYYFGGRTETARMRKLVYWYIAGKAEKDGTNSWPSRDTIAEMCCMSLSSVKRVLDYLEKHGLIIRYIKAHKTGKTGDASSSNVYTVLFPEFPYYCDDKKCTSCNP